MREHRTRNRVGSGWLRRVAAPTFILTCWATDAPAQCTSCDPVYPALRGDGSGDQFGFITDTLEDLDGDRVLDLLVTSAWNDEGGTNSGTAHVLSGATGELLQTWVGSTWELFGVYARGIGDVNADGVRDIAIGSIMVLAGEIGRVQVFSGADFSEFLHLHKLGEAAGDWLGTMISDAGDVDGDGFDDVLVGAPRNDAGGNLSGRVYVYSGLTGATIRTHDGGGVAEQFGYGLEVLPDLDGDGVKDHAIGAEGAGENGRVYLLSGADGTEIPPSPLEGDATSVSFGEFFVLTPGDVDGDGVADLYVSDFRNKANGDDAGRCWMFSGATGQALWIRTGENAGDIFGIGRPLHGDADGDGFPDMVIGALGSDELAANAGKAWLVSGRTGADIAVFAAETPAIAFGWDVTGLGDVDGDGSPDFAVSAALDDVPSVDAGAVYVLAGPAAVGVPAAPGGALLWASAASPNPFRPLTSIRVHLEAPGGLRASVFDASGRWVRTLAERTVDAGTHTLTWDGRNGAGSDVAPGTYFVRIERADAHDVVRKVSRR